MARKKRPEIRRKIQQSLQQAQSANEMRLDTEARVLLACGYKIEELICLQVDGEPPEKHQIVPLSFVHNPTGPTRFDDDAGKA